MTPLRQRMIREMQLRQFSNRTIESYVGAVVAGEDAPAPGSVPSPKVKLS